ncbi:MAG: hypothetical protein IPH12_20060 [Saprospirales bacterium]|nr:hypothetical protein [Saprospirales bacterium]
MPNLSFQYPAWFLILCALLGLGYAMLLYYRDTTFREQAPSLNRWLAVLRWLTITILSALLLSPLLKRIQTETKKPVVVLAQDVSESVGAELQGPALDQYKQNWAGLRDALAEGYDVHELAFGDAVREGIDFRFTDKVTNLSQALQDVYDRYGAQNVGAVILASDGIYNEGSNPAYSGAQIAAPVFTVALGDTTPKKDLLVKRVFHNKIAYLGDRFSVQIDLAALNCAGTQSVLAISKVEGEQTRNLQNFPVSVTGSDFFSTREVLLEADQPGVAQYRVSVAKVPGERSAANNTRDIFIDVLDARQKILLLANSPHPDLAALRQSLEGNKNYQVAVAFVNDPGIDVAKFDFVVLHNLPSGANDIAGILNTLNNKGIPRLFVAGMQTNYNALARAQNLASVQSNAQQSDDVQGKVSPAFAAFTLSPTMTEELPRFNPLTSAFGNFAATPQAQVLLWKRIGKVDTDQPLLAIGETNGIKTGLFLGEGLWKWRLFDYLQHNNHDIFEEIVGKTIQYLSLKEDKRKFRITLDKNIFKENEPVVFGAELYNDSYELTNDPDVAISVRNSQGKEFLYTFNKLSKAYTLHAGILPAGNYTFRATTSFNGQTLTYEGRFSVQPVQLELFETTANHAVLRQLSRQFGGETVYAAGLPGLADKIKTAGAIKPVIYQSTHTHPLINLKWLFLLLAGMLSVEWFLRRYFGAY